MKSSLVLASLLFIAVSVVSMPAETRVFTDAKGRQITAELISARDGNVTVRRKDGKTYTFSVEKLSQDDREFVAEWEEKRDARIKERDAQASEAKLAIARREKIVAFCKEKLGTQVGNGECWTLADEAFKASGAVRPGGDIRVWGRLVDISKESMQPGDVIEFKSAKISGYGTTAAEHTVVIVKTGRRKTVTIAQQNWARDKTVQEMEIDLRNLVSGDVRVYRPE